MLRLSLIGCGDHAQRYHAAPLAHYLANHPGQIELTAACDIDRGRAELICRQFGFARAYADWRQMLDVEKPDAVLAIVPAGVTANMGAELLERGVPVLLEKPLGQTPADAHRLAEIARRTGTPHMVSMNRRFIPRLNRGLDWAREQSPIRFVRCTMLRNRRTEPDFIFSTGVHAIDAMRYIAGDVVGHRVAKTSVGTQAVDWHLIDFDFVGGCKGQLHSAPTAGVTRETYELFGDNYSVQLDSFVPGTPQLLQCWRDGKLVIVDQAAADEPDFIWRGEYAETCEWIEAVRNGRGGRPAIEDVVSSMELGFGIGMMRR